MAVEGIVYHFALWRRSLGSAAAHLLPALLAALLSLLTFVGPDGKRQAGERSNGTASILPGVVSFAILSALTVFTASSAKTQSSGTPAIVLYDCALLSGAVGSVAMGAASRVPKLFGLIVVGGFFALSTLAYLILLCVP